MTASAVGAEFDMEDCTKPQNTGQNGHFTLAGCDHHRRTLNTRGANRGFTPENPLFTLTVDADTVKKYYERLGIKFFPTRYKPLTMVVLSLIHI